MKKNLQKRLERLYLAREKYKALERDIYKVFDKDDVGSTVLFDGTIAYVGLRKDYVSPHTKEFKEYIKKLYEEERIKNSVDCKESIYIMFTKKKDDEEEIY